MGRPRTIEDDALLAAARRIFRARGHAATTREVAREAGISQAVLYQRFGNKDELFFAAMVPRSDGPSALLGEVIDDARADLAAIARRLLTWLGDAVPSMLHIVTHPSFGVDAIGRAHAGLHMDALLDGLAGRIGRHQAAGRLGPVDAAAAARTFVAVVHGVALAGIVSGHGAGESAPPPAHHDALEQALDVIWQGLAP